MLESIHYYKSIFRGNLTLKLKNILSHDCELLKKEGVFVAKKKPIPVKVDKAEAQLKDFFDMVAPSAVKFMADHFIFGDTYRCVWAVREYPPTTSDQAILSRFGDKENVTLHIYSRYVDAAEQRKIIQNAQRKNKMLSTSEDLQESIKGEGNMNDVIELLFKCIVSAGADRHEAFLLSEDKTVN